MGAMKEEIRRAIANAAAPRGEGEHRAVFSQDAGGWTNMSWTDEGFFDHGAQAHVTLTPEGFYHHGLGVHVRLEREGSQLRGFDHGSGRHFNGTVQGKHVIVRDIETGRAHRFEV